MWNFGNVSMTSGLKGILHETIFQRHLELSRSLGRASSQNIEAQSLRHVLTGTQQPTLVGCVMVPLIKWLIDGQQPISSQVPEFRQYFQAIN